MLKSKEQGEILQSFFEFDHAKDTLLRLAMAFHMENSYVSSVSEPDWRRGALF